jgi:hypothetical protein
MLIFLTFGGPTPNYHSAVARICAQAAACNVFDRIIGKTDADLKADAEFWDRNGKFMETNRRGYGYWLWKSYIVKKTLEEMSGDDIMVYADAGCTMNPNGLKRLADYCDLTKASPNGILSFQMCFEEHSYTKMDVFAHLNAAEHYTTGQLIATAFLMRKCDASVDLVNRWYETCCHHSLIDDSPSKLPNHPSFADHRHDQSVWSILRKQSNGIIIDRDETYFGPNWQEGATYPILATRMRY